MKFITLEVGASRPRDYNKIAIRLFTNNQHNPSLISIYIGKNKCKELDFVFGDRILFSYEENNNSIWYIKKTFNNDGYKLSNHGTALRLSVSWKKPILNIIPNKTVEVISELFEDGLIIYADQPVKK